MEPSKFIGTLETLQTSFDATSLSYYNITVPLSNMSLTSGTTSTPIDNLANVGVEFDPGVSGMAFPSTVLDQLLSLLNLTEAQSLTDTEFPDQGVGLVFPYDQAPNDTTLDFQFGATLIQVPFWDMLTSYNETHAFVSLYDPSKWAVQPQPIMGAGLFSNAYFVFDFTHNQVSVAPLRHEALDDDDIKPINATGVAGLKGYVQQDTVDVTDDGSGLSTGAKAGIGIGAAIGALLIVAAVVFLVLRRRRRSRGPQTSAALSEEARKSAALSSQFGEKSELPAGPENTKTGTLSPLLSEWSNSQPRYPLVEAEGDERLSMTTDSNTTQSIKRRPLPPQELP